jgi:hypothetical protein
VLSMMETALQTEGPPSGSGLYSGSGAVQLSRSEPRDRFLRKLTASTADHYRAVPLSDGYHILFTDPRTGNLCLGTDAPIGSLTRLLRKVKFRPPPQASSSTPLLYAAGSNLRFGIRVLASFPAWSDSFAADQADCYENHEPATTQPSKNVLVFYSVPPDMFSDMSRTGADTNANAEAASGRIESFVYPVSDWANWWPEPNLQSQLHSLETGDLFDPFRTSSVYPLEIRGQVVATCAGVVNIAIDSGPEILLWAFGIDGWARCWKLNVGDDTILNRTAVLRDGSIRQVDGDNDIAMVSIPEIAAAEQLAFDLQPRSLDGTFSPNMVREPDRWSRDRMSGTVSVDLIHEARGVMRIDIQLR